MNALVCMLAALALVGCASTQYKVYESQGNVIDGRGGTRTVQDGMDIWDYGDPPRKFKLIGLIEDERPGGVIPMSQLRADIVKKAREAGGDAVIQIRSESQVMGYQSTGFATATSSGATTTATGMAIAAPLRRNKALFAVIKFAD